MSAADIAPELACVPSAIPAAERPVHFILARELFGQHALDRVTLSNGYAMRFPPEALEALVRFVGNERRCCPFLTFEIVIPPATEPLTLRMTGPEGTRRVLDAELNLTAADSCACC